MLVVWEIGLIDPDVVDLSNLQRQILYSQEDVGLPKVECAQKRLKALNPNVIINSYFGRLCEENALELIGKYDIVIDGTDNFETRYLVNDACVLLAKPNVHASIFRFEGQATVFDATNGPCYRCLYPEPPPQGLVPSCGEIGVLGVLPGIMACIQATEAIKLITGTGENITGRLLTYDALTMQFRELPLEKDPACALCGNNATINELRSVNYSCSLDSRKSDFLVPELTVDQLCKMTIDEQYIILDVREGIDSSAYSIEGSVNLPYSSIRERIQELDESKKIVVYCNYGMLSRRAAQELVANGFTSVFSLQGGINAWIELTQPEYSEL